MTAKTLSEPAALAQIMKTLDALPSTFQTQHRRAAIFAALDAAHDGSATMAERRRTWDAVRCYCAFPGEAGTPTTSTPIYDAIAPQFGGDPYLGGEPPTFGALMAVLRKAGAWHS
jgi:hypothetical protein